MILLILVENLRNKLYGLTPVYRDKTKRVTALYGYDHRKIKDNMQIKLNLGALGDFTNNRR